MLWKFHCKNHFAQVMFQHFALNAYGCISNCNFWWKSQILLCFVDIHITFQSIYIGSTSLVGIFTNKSLIFSLTLQFNCNSDTWGKSFIPYALDLLFADKGGRLWLQPANCICFQVSKNFDGHLYRFQSFHFSIAKRLTQTFGLCPYTLQLLYSMRWQLFKEICL